MATKSIVVSDISGEELADDQHVRVLVKHPDNPTVLELDISSAEADLLRNTALRLVEFEIFAPNEPRRTAYIETKTLDRLFKDVDFDAVLGGARKASGQGSRDGRPRGGPVRAPVSRNDRVDYTAGEHYGKLHRGRVTEEEAALVRANKAQASRNRQSQGHAAIDWNDEAEKRRYGLG
jgi:hypothetical protein